MFTQHSTEHGAQVLQKSPELTLLQHRHLIPIGQQLLLPLHRPLPAATIPLAASAEGQLWKGHVNSPVGLVPLSLAVPQQLSRRSPVLPLRLGSLPAGSAPLCPRTGPGRGAAAWAAVEEAAQAMGCRQLAAPDAFPPDKLPGVGLLATAGAAVTVSTATVLS